MGNSINALGNQVGRGVNYIDRNLKYADVLYWKVLPGLVVGFLTLAILFWINIPVGTNKYNILIYIFVPIVTGIIAGHFIYILGTEIYNPKFAAGLMGADLVSKELKSIKNSIL